MRLLIPMVSCKCGVLCHSTCPLLHGMTFLDRPGPVTIWINCSLSHGVSGRSPALDGGEGGSCRSILPTTVAGPLWVSQQMVATQPVHSSHVMPNIH